jgi:hypothetical protein
MTLALRMTFLPFHLHDAIWMEFPFSYFRMIFAPSATGHTFRRCARMSAQVDLGQEDVHMPFSRGGEKRT